MKFQDRINFYLTLYQGELSRKQEIESKMSNVLTMLIASITILILLFERKIQGVKGIYSIIDFLFSLNILILIFAVLYIVHVLVIKGLYRKFFKHKGKVYSILETPKAYEEKHLEWVNYFKNEKKDLKSEKEIEELADKKIENIIIQNLEATSSNTVFINKQLDNLYWCTALIIISFILNFFIYVL